MINLWRDDDISKYTDLTILQNIQALFDKYNKVHTVTLLMEDLWESRGVWEWLMITPNIDIALHGWNHDNLAYRGGIEIRKSIRQCLDYWNRFAVNSGYKKSPIRVFYSPWNVDDSNIEAACRFEGLEFGTITRKDYVYNFHWWEFVNPKKYIELEEALKSNGT